MPEQPARFVSHGTSDLPPMVTAGVLAKVINAFG